MFKKSSLFVSILIVLALSFTFTAMAVDYATVDISKVTSTGEGEPNNGFTPEVIFDGDEFTRWGSMNAGESVTAVFDKEYTIEAVEIRFFRAGVREHLFTLEYSLDGNNWTEIKSTKEHSTADESLAMSIEEDGYFETFPLVNAVTAKYFRYTYEGRIDGATIGSLWDMKFVVGAAPAASVEAPKAAAEEAPAVEAAAPEAEAPVPAPIQTASAPAPKTADPIALIAISTIISAAGITIAKKRK